MIKEREFWLSSSDGSSKLHTVLWEPGAEVESLLLISHGMTEHIMRYRFFARYLAEKGIAVAGHDHLGHGKTVQDGRFGYFADQKGGICLIRDMRRVVRWLRRQYPGRPVFMLGHSMGSFFLRRYLTIYGQELSGAVIMGTGDQPLLLAALGKLLSCGMGLIRGREYRSRLLHRLVLGQRNHAFLPARTESDWLSKNAASIDDYRSDPLCRFQFTCGAYSDFFGILADLKLHRQEAAVPRTLPLLLVSGGDDPVGDFGKGVERVFRHYLRIGMTDVKRILYPGDRHEILHETDKEKVWNDILLWLKRICHGRKDQRSCFKG